MARTSDLSWIKKRRIAIINLPRAHIADLGFIPSGSKMAGKGREIAQRMNPVHVSDPQAPN
jgi:hypothetical protein